MKRVGTAAAFIATVLAALCLAREASASGFAIRENGADALGTAFAGNASSATFLSTIFNNPAGMTHFTGDRAQVVGSLIIPTAIFKGSATETCAGAGGFPAFCPTTPTTFPIAGDLGGDSGQTAFVPAAYILHSFSPDFKFGLALTAPFGLETKYTDTWVGRYFGTRSEIETIDFNPNLAYRVNDWLSIGGGASAQYFSADLRQAIDFNALTANPPGTIPDGQFRVHGNDWGWGYNAGVLLEPLDGTNIGVAYRSRVQHTIEGKAVFNNVFAPLSGNPALTSTAAKASITTPDSVDLSVTQRITPNFHLAGDLQWTHWSRFKTLTIQRTNGTEIGTPVPENWRDTVFVAFGGTYNLDDRWTVRSGVAYDETPVKDQFRTVRLPDADRYWLAFGLGYKIREGFSVDLGYAHIFVPHTSINSSVNSTIVFPSGAKDTIQGSYTAHIDLISLQTRFRF